METVSEGSKYLDLNRCEAPDFVPKNTIKHSLKQKIFEQFPLLTRLFTAGVISGIPLLGTACEDINKAMPPSRFLPTPTISGQNGLENYPGKPVVVITPPTIIKEPTLVPIGGPGTEIPDNILKIKDKLDNKLSLTDDERQLVLNFNYEHPPQGYSLNREGKYIFVNDKGEKIMAPSLTGLTQELHTARGENVLAYYTNADNPYGLKADTPVGLFDPTPYIPENTPNLSQITWKIVLTPEVLTYLDFQKKLPNGGLFSSAIFDIKSFIDDKGLFPSPNINQKNQKEKDPAYNNLLESIIKNIEVFGTNSSITEEKLPQFVDYLNDRDKDTKLDSDTYYLTMFVHKGVYDQFPKDNGESFEEFLKRHEQTLNDLIKYTKSKVKLDKLIILDIAVDESSNVTKIKNSDGVYFFRNIYIPSKSDYSSPDPKDPTKLIDWGLIHELGHGALKSPDEYPIDTKFDNSLETVQVLEGIPEKWQIYWASRRKDISGGLMSSVWFMVTNGRKTGNYFIDQYTYYQLLRRIKNGTVHTEETDNEKGWAYPSEIPKKSFLLLGNDFIGSNFEIYRSIASDDSTKDNPRKGLKKIFTSTVSNNYNGSIELESKLFPLNNRNLVEAADSIILIKIYGKDGKTYFRYMDIRDFNLAYWQGYKDEVAMRFNLATAETDPETYDYTITYMPLHW